MIARFEAVNKFAAELMRGDPDTIVFSPISHTHPISMAGELPCEWEYWEKFDTAFLTHSKELIVLMLDGWEDSKGVNAEIKIAERLGIPILYCEP